MNLLASLFIAFLMSCSSPSDAQLTRVPVKDAKAASLRLPAREKAIRILESYSVDLEEISGAAWRTHPETKARELVLVGDREYRVVLIDWAKRQEQFKPVRVNLKSVIFPAGGAPKQSSWEAVASDGTGRLLILQEDPAQILVISADLTRLESRIDLTVPKGSPKGLHWNSEPNSRGEGLLPLSNGHVMILKEKKPLRLIEFAGIRQKSEGYRSGLRLGKDETPFPPKGPTAELVPMEHWELTGEDDDIDDGSEIATDSSGKIHLLSEESNRIVRLNASFKPGAESLQISQSWSLPDELEGVEGMVIDDENRPIVTTDRKSTKKPNLFLLSPLD